MTNLKKIACPQKVVSTYLTVDYELANVNKSQEKRRGHLEPTKKLGFDSKLVQCAL